MVILLSLLGCADPVACPEGWATDPDRLGRLAVLGGVAAPGAVCFSVGAEAGVTQAGVALLDPDWPDAALAARLLHLRAHQPLPAPGPDCLRRALEDEARAWHAELGLRQALGALEAPGRPPFTRAWLAQPGPAVVAAWLDEHPAGAAAVPASRDLLAERCDARR